MQKLLVSARKKKARHLLGRYLSHLALHRSRILRESVARKQQSNLLSQTTCAWSRKFSLREDMKSKLMSGRAISGQLSEVGVMFKLQHRSYVVLELTVSPVTPQSMV
jgi:hypothetical protein